jgi:hypothetical protein
MPLAQLPASRSPITTWFLPLQTDSGPQPDSRMSYRKYSLQQPNPVFRSTATKVQVILDAVRSFWSASSILRSWRYFIAEGSVAEPMVLASSFGIEPGKIT